MMFASITFNQGGCEKHPEGGRINLATFGHKKVTPPKKIAEYQMYPPRQCNNGVDPPKSGDQMLDPPKIEQKIRLNPPKQAHLMFR